MIDPTTAMKKERTYSYKINKSLVTPIGLDFQTEEIRISRRDQTTRHDTTRHDTTRHDTTRDDTTRQDRTRQDKTRQDKTGQDKTRQQNLWRKHTQGIQRNWQVCGILERKRKRPTGVNPYT
jgi:hypothetical protein